MIHPEAHYIETGYRYERISVPANRIRRAKELQALIAAEAPDDRELVRQLIHRGRKEYQTTAKG